MSSSVSSLIKRYETLQNNNGGNNIKSCELYSDVKMKDIITQFENNFYFDDVKRQEYDGNSVRLRFARKPTSVEEARASALKEERRYISEIRASQQEFDFDDDTEYAQFINQKLVWCKGNDNSSHDPIHIQETNQVQQQLILNNPDQDHFLNCDDDYAELVYYNCSDDLINVDVDRETNEAIQIYPQILTNPDPHDLFNCNDSNFNDNNKEVHDVEQDPTIEGNKDSLHCTNDFEDYDEVVYANYAILTSKEDNEPVEHGDRVITFDKFESKENKSHAEQDPIIEGNKDSLHCTDDLEDYDEVIYANYALLSSLEDSEPAEHGGGEITFAKFEKKEDKSHVEQDSTTEANNDSLHCTDDFEDYNEVIYANYALLTRKEDNEPAEQGVREIKFDDIEKKEDDSQAIWHEGNKYKRKSDIEDYHNFLEDEDSIICDKDKYGTEDNGAKRKLSPLDKKEHVVNELIDTEQKYIANLNLTIKNYKNYLDQRISESVTIFCNLPELLQQSQHFLAELIDKRFHYDGIGTVFLEQKQLFHLYPQYARKQQESNKLILEHKELIEERQVALRDKLGLKSHLLKPIQRITKYKLLLEQLEKELISGGFPSKHVTEAIKFVGYFIQKTNDSVLLASINNNPFYNTDPGDLIFFEDYKLLTPCRLDIVLFLFEKCIILAEREALTMDFIFKYRIHVEHLTRIYKEEKLKIHLIDFQNAQAQNKYVLKANTIETYTKCREFIDSILMKQFVKEKEKRNSFKIYHRNSMESMEVNIEDIPTNNSQLENTNVPSRNSIPRTSSNDKEKLTEKTEKQSFSRTNSCSTLLNIPKTDNSEPSRSRKSDCGPANAKSPKKKKKETKFDFGVFGNISNLNMLLMK